MYSFAEISKIKNVRTKSKISHTVKTTGNTGDVMPIYAKEILPGDFLEMDVETLIKMLTPATHTMDVAFYDIHAYWVPRVQLWKNWKAFQGEKTVGPHQTQPQYTIPKTFAPTGGWLENTIADYLGIPTKVEGLPGVDSAYFRAYAHIINNWYRDQNRQDTIDWDNGDQNTDGSNGSNYVTDIIGGGKCFKAAKIHDYFTSTLLEPQAGDAVLLPLGTTAPVRGDGRGIGVTNNGISGVLTAMGTDGGYRFGLNTENPLGMETSNHNYNQASSATWGNGVIGLSTWGDTSGIYADLSQATAATVNQLRMAFQLQKILEANNRSGSRYVEQLKARWGVTPSDQSLQQPEFLGGRRVPINIEMVVQTSSTNDTSPLGQMAGFSNTYSDTKLFSKSFEEHGIVMIMMVIRHQRTYQHGLNKKFTRTNYEDFYMPELQNIGETPVYNYEIFASGDSGKDNEVFGYQEYAAEYRFEPNIVTGQFRSNATNSFHNMHYADNYSETPVNGEEWIKENPDSVARTLTMTDYNQYNQFQMEFNFTETLVRSIPPHSIPGYIDHH